MPKVVFCISVDTDRDQDILRWLSQQRNRSEAIRDAIRSSWGVSLDDVYREVQELRQLVRDLRATGVILGAGVGVPDPDRWEEPPEAAAALDALARL